MDPFIQELNTCSEEDIASQLRTLGDLSVHFHVIKQHSLRYSEPNLVHNGLDIERDPWRATSGKRSRAR